MSVPAQKAFGFFSDHLLRHRLDRFPRLRFMGSKYRLLPALAEVFQALRFETAADPFCGSCAVSYLLKALGKEVRSSDFLAFCSTIASALIENSEVRLGGEDLDRLLEYDPRHKRFIERTFAGIFYTPQDLRFLDLVSWNLRKIDDAHKRAIALSALVRACVKRQPRGVFTVAGDPDRYKDGRRDLKLSLKEHFIEQVGVYNSAVFDNGRHNRAFCRDAFEADSDPPDLVYLDPPYVPRSDDNCYVKRYHFLEGLVRYWNGVKILEDSKVKKIAKPYTPFSYRSDALRAFDRLFRKHAESIIVLSYSSNGYPDLDDLVRLMRRYKAHIEVSSYAHRYHFGTHGAVRRERAVVEEYIIVGE